MPGAETLEKWLKTANAIVDEARAFILKTVREGVEHRLKPDDSYVTNVDLGVEELLRRRIETRFPEHGIIGEEYDGVREDARLRWTIDPIDGTHSFRHGLPLYATLLALLDGDRPVLAVIDLPSLDIRVSGARGCGVERNASPVRFEPVCDEGIEKEIVAIGERQQFVSVERAGVFDHLMASHDHVRTYCDAFGHVLTLEGRVGAMVDFGLHIWDAAPTELLVKEAGGAFETLFRGSRSNTEGRHNVVFGKPAVVAWLMDKIKEAGQ